MGCEPEEFLMISAGLLEIKNLSKNFELNGTVIETLKAIDLTIHPGEFVSIIGASGCGKTTLLKLIAGLERDFSGEIRLDSKPVSGPGLDRGMVFQEPRLFPWLSAEKNIAYGMPEKSPKNLKKQLTDEHIRLVSLQGFERAYPFQLSGGMQQRVSIARALVNRPKILLLDEPFSALDAMTRIQMQSEILRIREAEKVTMVLVTHDIDEAVFLGSRVVILSRRPGTVKNIIPVDLERPRDRSSHEFSELRRRIFEEFFAEENS